MPYAGKNEKIRKNKKEEKKGNKKSLENFFFKNK